MRPRWQNPGQPELQVGVHVGAELGLGAVLRVGQDGLDGRFPEVEVPVRHRGLLGAAESRVREVGVQVLAVNRPEKKRCRSFLSGESVKVFGNFFLKLATKWRDL